MFEMLMKRARRLLFGDVNHRIRKLQVSAASVERRILAQRGGRR